MDVHNGTTAGSPFNSTIFTSPIYNYIVDDELTIQDLYDEPLTDPNADQDYYDIPTGSTRSSTSEITASSDESKSQPEQRFPLDGLNNQGKINNHSHDRKFDCTLVKNSDSLRCNVVSGSNEDDFEVMTQDNVKEKKDLISKINIM